MLEIEMRKAWDWLILKRFLFYLKKNIPFRMLCVDTPLQFEEPWYFNTFSSLSEVAPLKRDTNVSCAVLLAVAKSNKATATRAVATPIIK
jgi:hypothetical protein